MTHGDKPMLATTRKAHEANRGKSSWNAGLTKHTDSRLAKASIAISVGVNSSLKTKGWHHAEETKSHLRKKKQELYATGWEPTCGRAKKYDYFSPIAGKIKVDGTWELIVCKHFDSLGIKWERNRKRFPYIRPDGKAATYQPDFYVEEWDSYVEVKGYQTELDNAKWAQFPHSLEVWKKAKIKELERGQDGNAADC